MRRVPALALVFLASSLHAQQDQTAVLATIYQFVDGFNKGNVPTALAACADQAVLIDDFPPHQWSGSGACAKWASEGRGRGVYVRAAEGVCRLENHRRIVGRESIKGTLP